ncbi:MAG TPA: hypothetical protein VFE42_07445 [Chloroflexota bacterium]|nr:hypothetical protein [Chloroflexota bacterium]
MGDRPMRYLVRCRQCDRAFWRPERDTPVPAHGRWDRRSAAHGESEGRCEGSARPGYWIGEGEGPITGWPR